VTVDANGGEGRQSPCGCLYIIKSNNCEVAADCQAALSKTVEYTKSDDIVKAERRRRRAGSRQNACERIPTAGTAGEAFDDQATIQLKSSRLEGSTVASAALLLRDRAYATAQEGDSLMS
jgi:hypothetical protein